MVIIISIVKIFLEFVLKCLVTRCNNHDGCWLIVNLYNRSMHMCTGKSRSCVNLVEPLKVRLVHFKKSKKKKAYMPVNIQVTSLA